MRGRPSHESDEVIVVLTRHDIRAEISNGLRVYLGGSIKTEADWDVLVLQITIDSLWASNNLCLCVVLSEVLSKEAGIGVGVISTNYDKTVKVKVCGILERVSELLWGLNLVASRAYKI